MITSVWKHAQAFMGNHRRRRGLLIGTMALSFALIVWGILRNWRELQTYEWRIDWQMLALSELVYVSTLVLTLLAWIAMMRTLRVRSSWRQDAKFYFYSWMARRLPTPAPYLASRILLYEEIGVPKRVITVGLVWENVLLIASAALLSIILLPFTPIVNEHILQAPVLIAAGASVVLVLFPSLLRRVINWCLVRFGKEPLPVFVNQAAAMLILAIYMALWLAGGLLLFLLIRAIHPAEWSGLPLVLQGWVLSGLISYLAFFAPFGLGLREVTLAYLLSLVVPLPVAIVVVVLSRLWIMINELVWAIVVFKI